MNNNLVNYFNMYYSYVACNSRINVNIFCKQIIHNYSLVLIMILNVIETKVNELMCPQQRLINIACLLAHYINSNDSLNLLAHYSSNNM